MRYTNLKDQLPGFWTTAKYLQNRPWTKAQCDVTVLDYLPEYPAPRCD